MRRLINWFNILIKKRKELKRWQRIVTVLAAVITFATTYALILPAITVEKDNTGEVAGMYLEKTADLDVLQEENALEPIGVSIAADMHNAVTFAYSDEDMTATAVFSTDEEIPEGTELVVNLVAPESEEYADLRSRSVDLLDKEFIYDVTTCSFYDYALICDNIDVTPKTGLADIQIIFRNNTVEHTDDMLFAGRFAKPAEEDELVSVNSDESSVIEITDGIITSLALKGNDLSRSDSIVGILAGNVDEETKAAAAETDAEIPDSDGTQEASEVSGSTETDGEEISTALPVKTLKVSGSDYTVTLSYDESSGIPDEAVLAVSEIAQDSKEYQTYLKEAKKAMGLKEEETLPSFAARFFDIKIMVDDQEFTPETGVSVEITYTEPLAEHPDTEVSAVHFADESAEAEVIEANTAEIQDDGQATVEFTAESFSVYGVIYTVDFEYSVNGKMYQFSLPGGGFVSFTDLVEVLGIIGDTNSEENGDENGSVSAENTEENAANEGTEENSVNSDTNTALTLGDVEVSEATRKFVEDVASVEFSSPELVDVSKVDADTTVGQIKESRGLECQYSAELTEAQIAEINAQTVEAGDWALISVQPFMSEETLTVTMKNGDQFTVKVTDEQIDDANALVTGQQYVLFIDSYYSGQHHYYTIRNDGETVPITSNDLDQVPANCLWTYWKNGDQVYWYNEQAGYRVYLDAYLPDNKLVTRDYRCERLYSYEGDGYAFRDFNYDYYLGWNSSSNKVIVTDQEAVRIRVYKPEPLNYSFTVQTSSTAQGRVSGEGNTDVISFSGVTSRNKKNTSVITATAIDGAEFVRWVLNGDNRDDLGQTIPVGGITFEEDNSILTAVFHKEYSSDATRRINEWVDGITGDPLTADKTAHVYDYDNRIYEIDFTASSSRYTVEPDISLELVTDTSRSMFFPENLLNPQSYVVNGSVNLGEWLLQHGDTSKTYFTIGDQNGTATMYAVYATGNEYYTQWNMVDASYYQAPDGKTRTATRVAYVNASRRDVYITTQFASNRVLTGVLYESTPKVSGKDWSRLDYLTSAVKAVTRAIYELDPGAEIGLVTFNASASGGIMYDKQNSDSLLDALDNISTDGGTNQTSALNLINNNGYFDSPGTRKQVAVLITDGAPQGTEWQYIERAADTLKGYDEETDTYKAYLYTLGLSLENVGDNKGKLFGISNGYAGNAENEDELVTEVIKLLRSLLTRASLLGDVSDTIDPAFYPVDGQGNPIQTGYYYTDREGGAITHHNSAPTDATKPYCYWKNDNGTWSVKWFNQEIKWPEDGGWEQKVFVKAKEDFLGGNNITTNVGDSNKIETNKIKHIGSPTGSYPLSQTYKEDFGKPQVNVDELTLTEHSTEWRVYLGTSVDPEKEIKELWNKIEVNQVILDNGIPGDTVVSITNKSNMYYAVNTNENKDNAAPSDNRNEKLPLTHCILNADSVIDGLINTIKAEETTFATSTVPYSYEGHSTGYFTVTLEKEVNADAASDSAPKKHETKEVGDNKEIYTLKVTFTPFADDALEQYEKTTSGHKAGKIADGYDGPTGNKIDSENVHKIHVFAKDLEIQKKDMTNTSKLIDTAKFKLYRTAKRVIDPETGQETNEYESGTVDLKVDNETKKVVQIGDEMTTSGGKITVEDLSYAPDGTYYLVETKAPDGYIMATEPIEMHLYLDDAYTHYLAPHGSITKAQTVNNPYNWTQAVNRVVYDSSKTAVVDDTKITIEVLNNPGVELPATGGPGTTLIYLLGIMLTAFAGAGLVLRKRRRDVA